MLLLGSVRARGLGVGVGVGLGLGLGDNYVEAGYFRRSDYVEADGVWCHCTLGGVGLALDFGCKPMERQGGKSARARATGGGSGQILAHTRAAGIRTQLRPSGM